MKYKKLGKTDLRISELCLGTMQFGWSADETQSHAILDAAWEAGINFIDTADIYSFWAPGNPGGVAETIIGNWLKSRNIPREQVVIATKARGRMGDAPDDEGLSRAHILKAVEGSLQRLGVDYIDLYQAHWFDEHTPIEETLRTMDELVRQGRVCYLGCSNYPAWRLTEALWTSRHFDLAQFESVQPHYNLVKRAEFERELSQVCRQYALGVIPYSPLAGGFLTGKYRPGEGILGEHVESVRQNSVQRYFTASNWLLLDKMEQVGAELGGASLSQVALAWLLSNPLVTSPIIGPRSLEQLNDNLGAAEFCLSTDQVNALNQLSNWKSD